MKRILNSRSQSGPTDSLLSENQSKTGLIFALFPVLINEILVEES